MPRLPVPGGDDGTWGTILNEYLSVELDVDGTMKRVANIASNKLMRTDGSRNFSAVTIGSGISFDGTTLSASIGTRSVAVKSANYTLTSSDDVILANAAGGSFTLTLPSAAANSGKIYTIKRTNATNDVAIATSQTIDGASSYTLTYQYQSIDLVSDGSNWFIT